MKQGVRKAASVAAVVVGVGLGIVYYRGIHPDHFPAVPTHALSSPNAFDYFQRAGDGAEGDLTRGQSLGVPAGTMSGNFLQYTPAQQAEVLRAVAPDLATLRQGFAYPYVNPPIRDWDAKLLYYPRFRALARILELEGSVKAAHGDWAGAASSYLDAIQIGTGIPHGSETNGFLVGVACEGLGRRNLWKTIPHLTAAEAKAAQLRLTRIESNREPLSNIFGEEKYKTQATLLRYYTKSDWASAITEDLFRGSTVPGVGIAKAMLVVSLKFLGKQKEFDQFTRYEDAVIKQVSSPYAAKAQMQRVPVDPVTNTSCDLNNWDPYASGAYCQFMDAKAQSQSSLLIVELALRQYYIGHGMYPVSLPGLVPEYLPSVPVDVFVLSGKAGPALKYRRTGSTYLLYSVGPDGVDNHGTPIAALPGSKVAYVYSDSKGDVVAGVNL